MTNQFTNLDVGDLPIGLGTARPVQLPSTRYRQGRRVQFHAALPVAELARIVQRPDPTRPLAGNRKVDANRAKKFAEYILRNKDWVSPAVIVRVPSDEVVFDVKVPFEDGTAWGVLSIPLDLLTEIVLLDGQHRTLGVFIALEMINDRIARYRETIAKMRDQLADPTEIRDQEKRLEDDLKLRKRLSDEHISIDIAEVGEDQAKQMFGDINNNSKGVNPDYTTLLDQRDVVNRIAVQVIETHVLLQDRVETGQSTRMTSANPNLVGAKSVADIVRGVLVGTGRVGVRVEDEIDKDVAANTQKIMQYLDVLIGAFDDLRDVTENRLTPKELRGKSMLGSATMLRVLAAVYHDLTVSDPDNGASRAWSRAEVEDFFRQLSPLFNSIPITPDDKLWLDTKAFLEGGTAPLASQGAIKSLVNALTSWARDGIPSYPEVERHNPLEGDSGRTNEP